MNDEAAGPAQDGADGLAPARSALDETLEHRLTFRWDDLPLVSGDLPGCGGTVRAVSADFVVRELPAYLPSGEGSHAYARVEKVGWTTRDLIRALEAIGLATAQVGVAGLKDKVATTEQWLSVPRRFEEAAWSALDALPGVRVLETSRHRNKLGMGHLRGNAFRVRVRGVGGDGLARAEAVAARLARVGIPNYFGPQRFGRLGRNAIDGARRVRGERVPGDARLQRFFVSALQSQVFNLLLAERVRDGLFERLVTGDWARKHDTGGTFEVLDAAVESPRAAAGEVSATIPLHGRKVRPSRGEAGERETRVLAYLGLRWTDLVGRHGDRRALRMWGVGVQVEAMEGSGAGEAGAAGDGGPGVGPGVGPGGSPGVGPDGGPGGGPEGGDADLWLAFELPKGSYATVLLREVTKVDVDAPLDGSASSGP